MSGIKFSTNFILELLAIFCSAVAFVCLVSPHISYYDDEFIGYWGYFKSSREFFLTPEFSQGAKDLKMPFLPFYWPIRSFQYIFWFPQTLLLLPFLYISSTLESVRLFSLLSLAVVAWIFGSFYKISPYILFLFLLAFTPWSFQHFLDSGASAWQYPLIAWALVYWRYAEDIQPLTVKSVCYCILTALLLFTGLLIKLSFVFFLPALTLLAFYSVYKRSKKFGFNSVALENCILAAIFISLSLLLLFSTDSSGKFYLNVITSNSENGYLSNILKQYQHFISYFSAIFINPAYTSHWVKSGNSSYSYSSLLYVSLAPLAVLRIIELRFSAKIRAILYLSATIITLLTLNAANRSFAIHHLVYLCPFLLNFFLELTSFRNTFIKYAIIFNIAAFAIVWIQIINLPDKEAGRDPPFIEIINSVKNESALKDQKIKTQVVIVGWGGCFGAAALLPSDKITVDCFFDKQAFYLKDKEYLKRLSGRCFFPVLLLHSPEKGQIGKIRQYFQQNKLDHTERGFGNWLWISWE